ncbi:glycoside hydrolase family 1 protein [Anaerorhabdus sp.]|uniref:glycoside hydrolase family 1 protein n=1 Tax=Anaerorhabdus sp. TaxID=1872524 RepID=UPI002FC7D48F
MGKFLWGASTSAYQVEGGWNQDGKGPSIQDVRSVHEGTADFTVSSDHYNRFREDVSLFKELGLNAYRFSIAWTRILPAGYGEINKQGVQFYHDLIDELLKNNIEPIVTIYHFDLPAELDKIGGWGNRKVIDYYLEFTRILFKEYGAKVKYWISINEQNSMVLYGGAMGTGQRDKKTLYQESHHMFLAQAKAIKLCHEMTDGKIGPALNIAHIYPKTCNPLDVLAAQNFESLRNYLYIDIPVYGRYNTNAWNLLNKMGCQPTIEDKDYEILANQNPDFVSINYYCSKTVEHSTENECKSQEGDQEVANVESGIYKGGKNEFLPNTEFGWQVDPVGFRITLKDIYEKYHLPIMISENGLGAFDVLEDDMKIHDQYRIDYYKTHINEMQIAREEGVDVFSYCPWSAIDLISTHQGFKKRYGFIYVDRDELDLKTLNRYKKDSFYWYKKVIESDGKEL